MPQSKKILVLGSLAYDHLMNYDGLFENVLLPEKLESLSVTFTTSDKKLHYGGCGGNIAYTLKLLGEEPLLLSIGGKDFNDYENWLKINKIDHSNIQINQDIFTASAYILTDKNQHQLTIFQMGAMATKPDVPSLNKLNTSTKSNGNVAIPTSNSDQAISWAIIAPENPERMLRIAQECYEHKIPYIFDPAQQIGVMKPDQLMAGLKNATVLITNDYEAALLTKKLGITKEKLATITPNYIETHSENGCSGKTPAGAFFVKAIPPKNLIDPTGCGDAFRAGVLAGLNKNLTLERACQIGTLAATYNLEKEGTQEHQFTPEKFKNRLAENFPE